MKKSIVFVVGYEDWGKTQTLNALREICESEGRRVKIKGTEFFIRSMSNDDRPEPYAKFIDRLSRPAAIAALCPYLKRHMTDGDDPSKSIDAIIKLLMTRGYELFFWVIQHKWGDGESIAEEVISALGKFGRVEVMPETDLPCQARARRLRTFIMDAVLR